MKIGISGIYLKFPASGIGQLHTHLLKALADIDRHNEYLLLGPPSTPWQSIVETQFPIRKASAPAFAARNENNEKLVWELLTGPAAAHKARVDVFHVPYFAPPLIPRTPTVVTIPDVLQLRLPTYQAGYKKKAYLNLISRAAHKATMIIAISHHAKQDIVNMLRISPERIRVTHLAAGDEYTPVTDPSILTVVRTRYGLGERYILYLGGLDLRKNVLQIVRSFAALYQRIGDPNLQLLIAGDPDKQKGPMFPDPRPVAAELGLTSQIIYRFVEEEDKPAIYSGASLFVFPSLYEGFGLTPLEAMSCGTPVICSNRTSLPEVVGDAAISLDPDDIQAWVEAMYSVLTDAALHEDLCARSVCRATQFSWRKTAAETLAIYEEAVARSKK